MLNIEIDRLVPGASQTMEIYGDSRIDDFPRLTGHDADLKYRCSRATLLGLHPEQNAPDLTAFIEQGCPCGLISRFALLTR